MQSSFTVSPGLGTATQPGVRARVVSTVALVALVHLALIAAMGWMSERPKQPVAIESPVITAQLLSLTPAPAAAPAPAVTSTPAEPPPAPHPAVRKKAEPHVVPRPVPAIRPLPTPAPPAKPTPAPVLPAPSEAATEQDSTNAQSAKTSEPTNAQAAAAPAQGKETLAIAAPKSVPHIDCRIVKPDYPALSRRRGETGTAAVRFVVGPPGAIESVELAKSSGYSRLDDAALAAMRESSCRPYVENGTPMRVTYTQPFGFALDN
jgi:protein TonB